MIGGITIQPSRCLRRRSRQVTCERCLDACPAGAITYGPAGVELLGGCLACGACVAACPTEALGFAGYAPERVTEEALRGVERAGGRAMLVCSHALDAAGKAGTDADPAGEAAHAAGGAAAGDGDCAADPDAPEEPSLAGTPCACASLPCLALVDEALLVGLAAGGVTRIDLVAADCDACPCSVGEHMADAAVERARDLLGEVGTSLDVCLVRGALSWRQRIDGGHVKYHLPECSGSASSDTTKEGDSGFAPLIGIIPEHSDDVRPLRAREGGVLPRFPSLRRDALLDALWELGEKNGGVAGKESEFWPTFSLDASRCSGCGACVRLCPTGALEPLLDGDGRIAGAEFFSGDCVACGLCETVCTRGAVRLGAGAPTKRVLAGEVDHVELGEPAFVPGKPESVTQAMRLHMNTSQVYTR